MGMRPPSRISLALIGLAIAIALAASLHGFTVDDALITARYAAHIAMGGGHRFNSGGPATDGVTPLPLPYLLAPFATCGPMCALSAARAIGLGSWLAAAFVLASHIANVLEARPLPSIATMIVAFGIPAVAAWSSSGMETGIATMLCTLAAVFGDGARRRWLSPVLLGLAAAFRPELLPYALVLSLGGITATGEEIGLGRVLRGAIAIAAAASPFALVSIIRWIAFGDVAPLAVRAKPSDLAHGLVYVTASWLVAGPPLSVLAPIALRRLRGWPVWLLVGFVVHGFVCLAVGGDWMPMSRLFVPVLPSLAIVFAHLANHAAPWSTAARAALSLAGQAFVLWSVGPAASGVMEDRLRLIHELSAKVEPSDVVAAVDIGWVGAAHRGTVVDLAGVTDPHVAALAGGHTTKRIPIELFDSRNVTHVVLLLPSHSDTSPESAWSRCELARGVEIRICKMPSVRDAFAIEAELKATSTLRYVLVRRVSGQPGQ